MDKSVPLRLLIFGSCVSRDILNHQGNAEKIFLVDYYARSSFASLGLQPCDERVELSKIDSAFQRRMVERDLCKAFFCDLERLSFDILLIDLIDERFDLYISDESSGCTLSNELYSSGFQCASTRGFVVPSGSEKFWQLWEKGWECFVKKLLSAEMLDRVLVNQVFWSTRTESGGNFEPTYSRKRIDAANLLLERMYNRMRVDLQSSQFICFESDLMNGSINHRWGLSPFHYIDAYYQEAIRQLAQWPLVQHSTYSVAVSSPPTAMDYLPDTWTDYSACGQRVSTYSALEDAVRTGFCEDGIHRVFHGCGSVDYLLLGVDHFQSASPQRTLLVSFSGPVANRAGKMAPFFSGVGISRSLGLPLLAISDSTLARDGSIGLAWYAGNDSMPDLPEQVATILDSMAKQFNCQLVLFGGSGGGYAVLSQLPLLKADAAGVVWNPQTSISSYELNTVHTYLSVAFPLLMNRLENAITLEDAQRRELYKSMLDEVGIRHELNISPLAGKSSCSLLYLQNRTDWHVKSHAVPFLKSSTWERNSSRSFILTSYPVACWFGDWGKGHAVPPKEMIESVLNGIVHGISMAQIAKELDMKSEDSEKIFSWFDADKISPPEIELRMDGNAIEAYCKVGHIAGPGYPIEYAFYLIVNGQRTSVRWYKCEPDVRFDIPKEARDIKIAAFIRDSAGTIVHSTINVPVVL